CWTLPSWNSTRDRIAASVISTTRFSACSLATIAAYRLVSEYSRAAIPASRVEAAPLVVVNAAAAALLTSSRTTFVCMARLMSGVASEEVTVGAAPPGLAVVEEVGGSITGGLATVADWPPNGFPTGGFRLLGFDGTDGWVAVRRSGS